MEWVLLYVGIGVCLAPWLYRGERKAGYLKAHDPASNTMLAFAISGWPYFIISLPIGWRVAKREALKQEARDFEALLERVRREDRRRVKQEFAEFDKELLADKYERSEDGKGYKIPDGTMSFEQMGTMFQELGTLTAPSEREFIDDTRLCDAPQFRVRDLPRYSEGGRV